jgi:leader peptidase (prepilin peptidase)/N-methyltransferase
VDELERMLMDPWWRAGVAFLLGACIGSFLNVVIYSQPRDESVAFPSSHCPGCDVPIRASDNIPVLSYLLLRGRCRYCAMTISARYPAVEFATAAIFAAISWQFGLSAETLLLMLFAAGLIVAAMVDFDIQIIPDQISLGGLAVGLVAMPLVWHAGGMSLRDSVASSLAGAALGGGTLWIVAFVHARLSVALGREFDHWPGEGEPVPRPNEADYWLWFPGLGLGDIKLLAMIGAFLGPWGVMVTILSASSAGLLMGVVYGLVTRSWRTPFGFGPAIAIGALLALFIPPSWRLFG